MELKDIKDIIEAEGLEDYNLGLDHKVKAGEIVVAREDGKWRVSIANDRAEIVSTSIREFDNELRIWIIQMGKIVQKYGKGHYDHQLRGLMSIVNCIDSDADISEKENYIISTYKDLISTRGGLGDFCIFDNNYERRLELNKPFEEARKNIWNIVNSYIMRY